MERPEDPRQAAEATAIVEALRAALRGRGDVHLALLFGSCARGTQRPDSDVDVAVLAPRVDRLELAAALSLATRREVQVVPLEQAGYPLLQALVRDALVLHEGKRGAAADWRTRALLDLELDRPWYQRMRRGYLRRLAEGGPHRG